MQNEFGGQLIIVENHTLDIFEIPWTEQRRDLYNANLMPNVRFDGKYYCRGADSPVTAANEYRTIINQRLEETNNQAQIEIDGSFWFEGGEIFAAATFRLKGAEIPINPRAFFLILVDGLIWDGLTYNDVIQAAYEEDIELDYTGANISIITSFTMDPDWTPEMIKCVAFAQDMYDSLQIRQSVLLPDNGPFNDVEELAAIELLRIRISPNPYYPAAHPGSVQFELSNIPPSARQGNGIEIFDSSGRFIERLALPAGRGSGAALFWDGCNWQGQEVPGGVYWARIGDASEVSGRRIVVIR